MPSLADLLARITAEARRVALRALSRVLAWAQLCIALLTAPLRVVPRGAGQGVATAFFLIGLAYGSALGGSGGQLVSGTASMVGLQATDIVITGQNHTSEADVLAALQIAPKASLVGFDIGEARRRVKDLPWVDSVVIRKLYPGRLQVGLSERQAAAIWQHAGKLTVIEESGAPITHYGIAELLDERFNALPYLVGVDAAAQARPLLEAAQLFPGIMAQTRAFIRVGNRRWDMQMKNTIQVKLPEGDMADNLAQLAALDHNTNMLSRQIVSLDMRVPGRVTVRLDEDQAAQRAELVEARLKAMKQADRKL